MGKLLPANTTIQLVRTRDGDFRATAEATDWPERVVLSEATTRAITKDIRERARDVMVLGLLGRRGVLQTGDIARAVGIRTQHARRLLRRLEARGAVREVSRQFRNIWEVPRG